VRVHARAHARLFYLIFFKPNTLFNDIGGACGTYGGGERGAQGVGGET
jgi:hypothetical protein